MSNSKKAVFLERDGVLLDQSGCPDSALLKPLHRLAERYQIYGLILPATAGDGAQQHLEQLLASAGIPIAGWLQSDAGERCLKEGVTARLVESASADRLKLAGSFLISDLPELIGSGVPLGCNTLYVSTARARAHLQLLQPEQLFFHHPADAMEWILHHPRGEADLEVSLAKGAEALRRGELVAFPTETVYGIGADALNSRAVEQIFVAKKRPRFNPLIVHIADRAAVDRLAAEIPQQAKQLMDRFWPGPLTLILPKKKSVPDIVTAGHPTVGIRMPGNRLALELIRRAGVPVAAPSANEFTCTSPTNAAHVREQLHGVYAVLIDGGACRVGVESTVLTLAEQQPRILRPGGISREQIEAVIGPVQLPAPDSVEPVDITSPGMFPVHYAPRTPLELHDPLPHRLAADAKVGWVLLNPPPWQCAGPVAVLSGSGDLEEAAQELYATLRRMDSLGLRLIISHRFPENGIGAALNDRIGKAAQR